MTECESNELIEKMQNESIRSRVELQRRNNVRVCSCVETMYFSGRERASFSGPRGLTPFEALFVGHLNRMMQRVLRDAVPRLEMFGYKLASSH